MVQYIFVCLFFVEIRVIYMNKYIDLIKTKKKTSKSLIN